MRKGEAVMGPKYQPVKPLRGTRRIPEPDAQIAEHPIPLPLALIEIDQKRPVLFIRQAFAGRVPRRGARHCAFGNYRGRRRGDARDARPIDRLFGRATGRERR